jgi:hypothetical protein
MAFEIPVKVFASFVKNNTGNKKREKNYLDMDEAKEMSGVHWKEEKLDQVFRRYSVHGKVSGYSVHTFMDHIACVLGTS